MKPEGWGFEMVKLDGEVVCYPILALFACVCIFSVIKRNCNSNVESSCKK